MCLCALDSSVTKAELVRLNPDAVLPMLIDIMSDRGFKVSVWDISDEAYAIDVRFEPSIAISNSL